MPLWLPSEGRPASVAPTRCTSQLCRTRKHCLRMMPVLIAVLKQLRQLHMQRVLVPDFGRTNDC